MAPACSVDANSSDAGDCGAHRLAGATARSRSLRAGRESSCATRSASASLQRSAAASAWRPTRPLPPARTFAASRARPALVRRRDSVARDLAKRRADDRARRRRGRRCSRRLRASAIAPACGRSRRRRGGRRRGDVSTPRCAPTARSARRGCRARRARSPAASRRQLGRRRRSRFMQRDVGGVAACRRRRISPCAVVKPLRFGSRSCSQRCRWSDSATSARHDVVQVEHVRGQRVDLVGA